MPDDSTAAAPPAPPDPETIAYEILARIQLQPPQPHTFPPADTRQTMSYTGWHMWLWHDPASPVTASETHAGITVTLNAQPTHTTWAMGNNDTVTCTTSTPWTAARTNGGHNVASPTCGYKYVKAGTYLVTATTQWQVTWTGAGQSGVIPFPLSTSRDVIVGELQSLVTNP